MVHVALEEALACLLSHADTPTRTETLALEKASGRVLAQDYTAPLDNPPFNRSPLDGYAFRASDSMGATVETPVTLKVVGEAYAGAPYEGALAVGEAVRIMTGAAIPSTCDCVLRQEDTDEGEVEVKLYKALNPFDNYCY